jgi:hypothetical protein
LHEPGTFSGLNLPAVRESLESSEKLMVRTLNAFAAQSDLVMPGQTEG